MHSITNSYTVTTKLHRVGNHLSIIDWCQPNDYGCSFFHPTIGSEAFILSTLATLVPSHDITREFSQFSGVLSLFQLLFGSCFLQLGAFSLDCAVDEVSQMLFGIKLAAFYSWFVGELHASPLWASALVWCLLFPCVCPSYLGRFLPTYLVPSVRLKLRSASPYGTLDWQPMFPFMGVVGDSTTGPFFIDWFSFLGIRRRLVILIKGDLGLFDTWTLSYSFHILPLVISWTILSRLHPHSQLLATQTIIDLHFPHALAW